MRHKIKVPDGTGLRGSYQRGTMHVSHAGKPPKLRFQPGCFIRFRGQLFEIMYAFRSEEAPAEWQYCLEERQTLSSQPQDYLGQLVAALGAGKTTPRIVYQLFRNNYEAHSFFMDLPCNGNRSTVKNQTLLNDGEVVSSGEVL